MDRKTLETLYSASREAPARIFARAASENPLGADNYAFLLEHVDELNVDVLVLLLRAQLHGDAEPNERPFVKRLAKLVPSADATQLLAVLDLSKKISAEAWLEDLTLPLREVLPAPRWYRFVDKVRGGEIFNALNSEIPRRDREWRPNPDECFVTSIEEGRPEPLVVGLLDQAHDDLAGAKFALRTLPVVELLRLHDRFPKLVDLERVKQAVASRATSDGQSWAPGEGDPPLPGWMAPSVAERLRACPDQEARVLYEWLFALPSGLHDADPYELALARFAQAPLERFWHTRLGRHLSTGASWKKRGRTLIERCMALGQGFPPEVIRTALDGARESDGATIEKHRKAILSTVHDEAAKIFVERAHALLTRDQYQDADLVLSALMSLEPGSFITGALRRLRSVGDLPEAISTRIDACESLARASRKEPTEDAFLEAFLVLARQRS